VRPDLALDALPADPDREVDPGEPGHPHRAARSIGKAGQALALEVADPFVRGLPADPGGLGCRTHLPVRLADAPTEQVPLVRVETRPRIDHHGAPFGCVISTTTSTVRGPSSVNNVSGKYS